jgi:hypothetical protein
MRFEPCPVACICHGPTHRTHLALKHNNIPKRSLHFTIHAQADVTNPLHALVVLERLQATPAPVELLSDDNHTVWPLHCGPQPLHTLLEEEGQLE